MEYREFEIALLTNQVDFRDTFKENVPIPAPKDAQGNVERYNVEVILLANQFNHSMDYMKHTEIIWMHLDAWRCASIRRCRRL